MNFLTLNFNDNTDMSYNSESFSKKRQYNFIFGRKYIFSDKFYKDRIHKSMENMYRYTFGIYFSPESIYQNFVEIDTSVHFYFYSEQTCWQFLSDKTNIDRKSCITQ